MKKWLLVLFTLLALSITPQTSNAAFIVVPKDAPAKTATTYHKPFGHRKIPAAFSAVRKVISGDGTLRDHSKPGWLGVVSFACSMFAIATIFLASIPGLSVLFSFYLLAAIAGIIFGGIGLNKRKYSNTGYAIAGLVLGIVEVVALILLVVLIVAALSAL
jgi:hypothetical protein